jgi:AcrR family transcriptional regulator
LTLRGFLAATSAWSGQRPQAERAAPSPAPRSTHAAQDQKNPVVGIGWRCCLAQTDLSFLLDCDLSTWELWNGMDLAVPASMDAQNAATVDTPLSPRDRLLDAATRLFCRFGINAVGVDTIVEAAGTAKTTLYNAFGSKDGLVEAVLEREGRTWRTWFLAEIDGPGGSARERLARIGPTLKLWFRRDDFFGCPFINAVGETDKSDDRIRSLAIAHKTVVLDRLLTLCAEAGLREPGQVAHALGLVMDGAVVTALITRDISVADVAHRACEAILSGSVAS